MKEVVEIIIQHASIWAPAVTAVIGIVSALLMATKEVRSAMAATRLALKELKQEDTIKKLTNEIKTAAAENKAIREELDIIVDELKRIKNYRELKK